MSLRRDHMPRTAACLLQSILKVACSTSKMPCTIFTLWPISQVGGSKWWLSETPRSLGSSVGLLSL
jgi:hypothetical protein